MEEAVKDALLSAGGVLAEAVRAGLLVRGYAADLQVRAVDGRLTVVSRDDVVWRAETGSAGVAPCAPLTGAARAACGDVVKVLHGRLQEAWR